MVVSWVNTVSVVPFSPPVAAVNQPSNVWLLRVGVGRTDSLPSALGIKTDSSNVSPPFTSNLTAKSAICSLTDVVLNLKIW